MDKAKKQRRRFDLPPITTAGDISGREFELDIHAGRITGIALTADREDLAYHRGTLQLEVDGEKVIREETHARLLMSGLGVEPDRRLLSCDIPRGNGQVKVSFSDIENPVAPFSAYTVSIYLELEIHDC